MQVGHMGQVKREIIMLSKVEFDDEGCFKESDYFKDEDKVVIFEQVCS